MEDNRHDQEPDEPIVRKAPVVTVARSIILPCRPEAAFAALTQDAIILKWWGDDVTYRTIEWQADVRSGGSWKAIFQTPDGQHFGAGGEYGLLEAPYVLNWTWTADWMPHVTKHIGMTFTGHPNGTTLQITSIGHQSEQERVQDESGWDQILAWLKQYCEQAV